MERFEKITKLIEKYFDGETTLEEERILMDYFGNTPVSKISGELLPYVQLFRSLAYERAKVPALREARLSPVWITGITTVAAVAIVVIAVLFVTPKFLPVRNRSVFVTQYVNGREIHNTRRTLKNASEIIKSVSKTINSTLAEIPNENLLYSVQKELSKTTNIMNYNED